MKRSNDFLKIHDILVFLDLSVSIANVTIDLCHRKCFNIILPFLLYSLGENKLYTFRICSTPKLSKYDTFSAFTYKATL